MEEGVIDQLCYTRSDVGLGNMSVGHRVRAASPGLQDIRGERYRNIDRYLRYQLPSGINPNTLSPQDAPICLSLIDSGTERLLVRKVYKGRDFQGRPGLYFTHLLAGLPHKLSMREAILLWHAQHLWISDESLLPPGQTYLRQLSVSDLEAQQQNAWNTFNLDSHLQAALRLALEQFLRSSPPEKLYLSGSSESIATIIWGITQSLPYIFFQDVTFSTYEASPTSGTMKIVGLFSERYVPPLSTGDVSISVDAVSTPLPITVEASAQQYIDFAVHILSERHSQAINNDQLYTFIALAEQQLVHNPTELFALYQRYRATLVQVPSLPKKMPAQLPSSPPPSSPPPSYPTNPPRSVPDLDDEYDDEPPVVQPSRSRPLPQRVPVVTTPRRSATYRGVHFSVLLNAALLLLLLALIIYIPLSQNSVRQEAVSNAFMQLTQTAHATSVARPPNTMAFLATSADVPPSAHAKTRFALFVEVQNNGSNTWLPQQGYQLKCVPDLIGQTPDQDCPQTKSLSAVAKPVLSGQYYIFAFVFSSSGPPGNHFIKVRLFQGNAPFGPEKLVSFKITA